MDMDNYRTFALEHFGTRMGIAVYANNDEDRVSRHDTGEVVTYITSGGCTCALHMTPEQARHMAELLTLAASEALPVALAEAA